MSVPADIKQRLALLRECFLHSSGFQDWVADWWAQLRIDDRRLLLALAGLDDSEKAARRQWRQQTQESRDVLLVECKRVARLVEGLRWA